MIQCKKIDSIWECVIEQRIPIKQPGYDQSNTQATFLNCERNIRAFLGRCKRVSFSEVSRVLFPSPIEKRHISSPVMTLSNIFTLLKNIRWNVMPPLFLLIDQDLQHSLSCFFFVFFLLQTSSTVRQRMTHLICVSRKRKFKHSCACSGANICVTHYWSDTIQSFIDKVCEIFHATLYTRSLVWIMSTSLV